MKVLIVEDDEASRIFLQDMVQSQGYETQVATDGKRGLEAFNQFNPDLVLSDIRMPQMDGLEMLKEIRKVDSNVIVVMNTAFGCEEYAIKALHLRANNYLKKPIRHKDLLPLFHKIASVVKKSDPTPVLKIEREISKTHFTLNLQSAVEEIPDMVNLLLKATAGSLDEKEILNTKLALTELLTNAIENGNLEITSEEWGEAFIQGEKGLYALREKKWKTL
jgi:DNA-binding response OmpR family regulator